MCGGGGGAPAPYGYKEDDVTTGYNEDGAPMVSRMRVPKTKSEWGAERAAEERQALAKKLNETSTESLGRRRRMRAQSLLASGGADDSGNLTIGTAQAKPTLGS